MDVSKVCSMLESGETWEINALRMVVKQMRYNLIAPERIDKQTSLAELGERIGRVNHLGRKGKLVVAKVVVINVDKPLIA